MLTWDKLCNIQFCETTGLTVTPDIKWPHICVEMSEVGSNPSVVMKYCEAQNNVQKLFAAGGVGKQAN